MKIVQRPIEVICSFTKQGTINPVRFRLLEDDNPIVVDVKKIIHFTEEKLGRDIFITFRCQSYVLGIFRDYELRFYKQECKWVLWKI